MIFIRPSPAAREQIRYFIIALAVMSVVASSGCFTLASDTVEDVSETIGNATCIEMCNACQICSENFEDKETLL